MEQFKNYRRKRMLNIEYHVHERTLYIHGTNDIMDMWVNIIAKKHGMIYGRVHYGYLLIASLLNKTVLPMEYDRIEGFSMGGAIGAVLAATVDKPAVCHAAPPVGDEDFYDHCKRNNIQFKVLKRDPILLLHWIMALLGFHPRHIQKIKPLGSTLFRLFRLKTNHNIDLYEATYTHSIPDPCSYNNE